MHGCISHTRTLTNTHTHTFTPTFTYTQNLWQGIEPKLCTETGSAFYDALLICLRVQMCNNVSRLFCMLPRRLKYCNDDRGLLPARKFINLAGKHQPLDWKLAQLLVLCIWQEIFPQQ